MNLTKPSLLKKLFVSPLDWSLIAVPAAVMLRYIPAWHNDTALFFVAGVGIIPLAGWLGRATDGLAKRVGSGIGGLLNATFGNAAELIIALMALSHGLVGVVKASITGSIIGNILLVLGVSALLGGLRHRKQTFNATAARISATALGLAVIGLLIPTVFHIAAKDTPSGWSPRAEQHLSLAIAIVLFISYGLSLVFTLGTHRELFTSNGVDRSKGAQSETDREPIWWSVTMLAVATALVAWLSEFLVGAVETMRRDLGLTETFVGVVIVAVVGNAAEHFSAVMAALKNKMDLSLSVTVGSSTQVALFVTPLLIFASYAWGEPMSLEFTLPEVAAVALAVWIVQDISGDGETNWMEGVQLLCVYLIIGILFLFMPRQEAANGNQRSSVRVQQTGSTVGTLP